MSFEAVWDKKKIIIKEKDDPAVRTASTYLLTVIIKLSIAFLHSKRCLPAGYYIIRIHLKGGL